MIGSGRVLAWSESVTFTAWGPRIFTFLDSINYGPIEASLISFLYSLVCSLVIFARGEKQREKRVRNKS